MLNEKGLRRRLVSSILAGVGGTLVACGGTAEAPSQDSQDITGGDTFQCEGFPACDDGDTQVPSSSDCLQDDATCYERTLCGTTIWCTN
jgi:hypothetical protein